ncbi:MAG: spore germination protein GerW family protein [Candidatus Aminicenantes bacterium]|jgi:uncharacterized spore protein YtfJ
MDAKDIIKDVTEKIQKNANVKAVFGEPYEKENLTVIPVARVSICGCGGSGSRKGKEDEENQEKAKGKGMGFGLHVKAEPVGYIEIDDEGAHFEEIIEQKRIIMAQFALGAFAIFSFVRFIKKLLKC